MNYDIVIIGGGTSAGFLLAFLNERETSRKPRVLLLEKTKEPFRKVYCSGNGRCNFSNTDIDESSYYSVAASDAWKKKAFEAVAQLDLQRYFLERGIPSCSDEFGRLMPYTNAAATVGSFFERQLKAANVTVKNWSEAVDVSKNGQGFAVRYKHAKETLHAQAAKVVYACGGSAYPQLGTDGSGFDILRKLGHTVTKQFPGIVPLETKETAFHVLAGLKMECRMAAAGFSRKGELLFTKYGISGPNVLYASNAVSLALAKGPVQLTVDFLPEETFTLDYFKRIHSKSKEKTVFAAFDGTLRDEFLKVFIAHHKLKSGIAPDEVENVYNKLKNVTFTVTGTRPFREAQVSLGGIFADEIDPVSFESKLHKNLFVTGEAIDHTGGCGGYNIHWCAATAKGVADRLGATV